MPRSVVFAALTAFVLMLGLGVLFPVLPKFTTALGIPDAHAGWLLAAYPLASFVASPLWGRFSNAFGRKPAIVIGLCGYALGFGLFGIGQTFAQLLAARVLGGLLSAAALPALFAYVADVTTAEKRSSGMGALGAAIGLGVTFGPAIGALTDAWLGVRAPYFVSAAIGLANAVVVAFALPESLGPEARAARGQGPGADRSPSSQFAQSAANHRVWPGEIKRTRQAGHAPRVGPESHPRQRQTIRRGIRIPGQDPGSGQPLRRSTCSVR